MSRRCCASWRLSFSLRFTRSASILQAGRQGRQEATAVGGKHSGGQAGRQDGKLTVGAGGEAGRAPTPRHPLHHPPHSLHPRTLPTPSHTTPHPPAHTPGTHPPHALQVGPDQPHRPLVRLLALHRRQRLRLALLGGPSRAAASAAAAAADILGLPRGPAAGGGRSSLQGVGGEQRRRTVYVQVASWRRGCRKARLDVSPGSHHTHPPPPRPTPGPGAPPMPSRPAPSAPHCGGRSRCGRPGCLPSC